MSMIITSGRIQLIIGVALVMLGSFALGSVFHLDRRLTSIHPLPVAFPPAQSMVSGNSVYAVKSDPLQYKNLLVSYAEGCLWLSDDAGSNMMFSLSMSRFLFSGCEFKVVRWTANCIQLEEIR